MSRRKAWTALGGIWGGGIAMILGPIPAAAATWLILEDWLDGNGSEEIAFALLWGATFLWSVVLGAASGFLLGSRPRSPV